MRINELVKAAHENAISKGWWEEDRSFGEIIALIHSEASEALEDHRNGREVNETWYEYKNDIGDVFTTDDKEHRFIMRESTTSGIIQDVKELGKPCGIPSELADICIRVFDACGRYGIDLEQAISEKMAYNATRSHKHGGKVI